MTYNSLTFCIFFAILILFYILCAPVHKWKLLLAASLVFYAFAGIDKLLIVFATSLAVYWAGYRMGTVYVEYDSLLEKKPVSGKEKQKLLQPYKKRCKQTLVLTLCIIIGILIYCKFVSKAFNLISNILDNRISGGGYIISLPGSSFPLESLTIPFLQSAIY